MKYSELKALYINCTLKKSPTLSHTQGLIDLSRRTMESRGVQTESFRLADFVVPPGMQSDMTEGGYDRDDWPKLWPQILEADILCLAGPIWLGENSSVMRILMERLYAMSGLLNEQGQYSFYGKVGCTLLSGNEDGVKHAAMGNLYGLQHIGYTIAPQADAGWIGTIGPGLSYLDEGSGGPENDFTNRNTVFMSWNAMHLAALLKENNFYPPVGNSRRAWDEGDKTGFIPRQSS
jgi:multimeric flavodoxin WrbA